jgi:hypothetical protein
MKKMNQPNLQFDFDKETDVLHITLGTCEPSYCEEVDDIVLVERGMFSHQITGFQIMDIGLHGVKKVEIIAYIEQAAKESKQQIKENLRLVNRLPNLIDKELKWKRISSKEKTL